MHTSSIIAVGSSDGPRTLDEKTFNETTHDPYMYAKTLSEKGAWEFAQELEVPLVCLNPAAILVRYDYRNTPITEALLELANGTGKTFP